MTIGDRLRAEMNELVGRESRNLDDEYRSFMDAYRRRLSDSRSVPLVEDKAEGPELGIAAYTLGVHYSACDKTEQAEYWLHIAARYDIGDAALRLAHLYEVQSLAGFDSTAALESPPPADNPKMRQAYFWYQRAAEAGYTMGEEQPSLDLNLDGCCQPVVDQQVAEQTAAIIAAAEARRAQAERYAAAVEAKALAKAAERASAVEAQAVVRAAEKAAAIMAEAQGRRDLAEQIVVAALEQAAMMERQARDEVQLVVDEARQEVEQLAEQRQSMALHVLARLISQPRRTDRLSKRFLNALNKRREDGVVLPAPSELEQDIAHYAHLMLGLPNPKEPVSVDVLARLIQEVAKRTRTAVPVDELAERRRTRLVPGQHRRVRTANA